MTITSSQPLNKSSQAVIRKTFQIFLVALLIHIPLALLMDQARILATIHAYVTLLIGIIFLAHDESPTRVIYLIGYLCMAEVLWRMTGAGVFWEYGKYAIVLLFILTMLKYQIRMQALPVLYMALLLPSVFMLSGLGLSLFELRSQISFNLSGPLCLMFAVTFFNQYKFRFQEFKNLMLWMLLPVIAISTLVLYKIITAEMIIFTDESSFLTSGGYGPNQVSAILGLGALLAWIYFMFKERLSFLARLIILGLMILFFFQSMLTYSRGGLLNLIFALPLATIAAATKVKRSSSIIFFGITAIILVSGFLIPRLEAWTGGTLSLRYLTLDTSGRAEIIFGQVQTFLDNPFMGVGPGASRYYTPTPGGEILSAHTEFSRVLAEHGAFGVISIFILLLMVVRVMIRSKSAMQFWLSLAFIAWALVDMSHAAMRISAVPLMFGLSQVIFDEVDG